MVISRKRHRTANKNGPPQASLIEVEDAGIATATARRRSLQRVVEHAQTAGRGRTALRYLAAYVKKSAFSEGRLLGYDQSGCIVLSYRDSADGKLKSEALDPLELIRRWLLHLLPKGLVRVRHYGWLSPAAQKAFLRVRFLLGLGPYRIPPALKNEPPRCPFCNGPLAQIARIAPQRGPPLCQAILKAAP